MAWELVAMPRESPAWVHWIDKPAVSRALRTMAYQLAHPIDTSDINGNDENFGWQKTVELFQTLRSFAIACDLAPTTLGYYAGLRLGLDPGADDVPGLYTNTGTLRTEVFRLLRRHSEAVRNALAPLGPVVDGWSEASAYVDVVIQLRVDFDAVEGVAVRRGNPPRPGRGFDRQLDDSADHLGSHISWLTTTWAEFADVGASRQVFVECYAPVQVSYELATRVARAILERGAAMAVTRSYAFVIVRNARVAALFAGEDAPDEDVLRAAAAFDAAAISAPDFPPAIDAVLAAFKVAGDIAAEIPGGEVAKLVVTLVSGIVLWPYLIFGAAVGRWRDVWGRAEPRLYGADYAGSLLPPPRGTAPRSAPPAPPFDVVDQAIPPLGFEQWELVGGEPFDSSTGRGTQAVEAEQAGGGAGLVLLGLGAAWLAFGGGKKRGK